MLQKYKNDYNDTIELIPFGDALTQVGVFFDLKITNLGLYCIVAFPKIKNENGDIKQVVLTKDETRKLLNANGATEATEIESKFRKICLLGAKNIGAKTLSEKEIEKLRPNYQYEEGACAIIEKSRRLKESLTQDKSEKNTLYPTNKASVNRYLVREYFETKYSLKENYQLRSSRKI